MPFTYRSYATPSPSPSPPDSPERSTTPIRFSGYLGRLPIQEPSYAMTIHRSPSPVDADGSIVLGDLVRSGEASRLRRRGAVRLDHTSRTGTGGSGGNARASTSRAVLGDFGMAERDPDGDSLWNGDGEEHMEEPTWEWAPSGGALVQDELAAAADTRMDGPRSALYCGVPDWSSSSSSSLAEWSPPPFASAPRLPAPVRNTGCGALVHAHAAPRNGAPAWSARCAASSTVVSLSTEYAPPNLAERAARSACGCVREVVGCAVCGNALGTRYIPCKAAANGLFSASACCKSSRRSTETEEIECMYTFSADAVSPDPSTADHTPPAGPSSHHQVSPSRSLLTTSADNVVYTLRGERLLPLPTSDLNGPSGPSVGHVDSPDDSLDDPDDDKTPAESSPPAPWTSR